MKDNEMDRISEIFPEHIVTKIMDRYFSNLKPGKTYHSALSHSFSWGLSPEKDMFWRSIYNLIYKDNLENFQKHFDCVIEVLSEAEGPLYDDTQII